MGGQAGSAATATATTKRRADVLMVQQGLADSRAKAQALIMAGAVVKKADQNRIDKPGQILLETTALVLAHTPLSYVSRGGLKLHHALRHFDIDVEGRSCLDVGASTGGFTDCLLQHGARQVVALDVGYNQLDYRLRNDARVIVRERHNVRRCDDDVVPGLHDIVVIDVSFIGLSLVMSHITRWLKDEATMVALIKPQFEVGPKDVGKGGIVSCEHAQRRAQDEVRQAALTLGFRIDGIVASPILGAKGNKEFLMTAHWRTSWK